MGPSLNNTRARRSPPARPAQGMEDQDEGRRSQPTLVGPGRQEHEREYDRRLPAADGEDEQQEGVPVEHPPQMKTSGDAPGHVAATARAQQNPTTRSSATHAATRATR